MADYPKSLKAGATAADKAVINAAAAANSTPSGQADAMGQVNANAYIDLVLAESNGGTFDAKVWWFYAEAEQWVEDLAVGTLSVAASGTAGSVLTPSSASAIYIEVLNFAGGARASAWLIGRSSRNF